MRRTGDGLAPLAAGLLLAWGGTGLLVSPLAASLDPLLGQLALWLIGALVVAVVLLWERKPLTSLWLQPLDWRSWAWAAVLVIAHFVVIFPATEWVRREIGLPGYAAGMEAAVAQPVWLRILAVVTAGVVEEVLFRGYAATRLLRATGSALVAVVLSSAAFAALHLPLWGPGPSLSFFLGGLATTAFFLWRRDLGTMILAHVAIDTWAIVVSPAFSPWWRGP